MTAVGLFLGTEISAQSTTDTSAPKPPPFRAFRHDEDYARFADPRLWDDLTGPIKYISLAASDRDSYVSIGGELRLRGESYRHPELGRVEVDRNDYGLSRFELHADVHWTRQVRVFTELISGQSFSEELPAQPSQDNDLDLQQAFADFTFGGRDRSDWRVRAGRMEMGFGSYRLVAPRDGANLHFNYEGARVTRHADAWSFDAFLTRPVEQKIGAFDDKPDRERVFWGAYVVTSIVPKDVLTLDTYYLGLRREDARFGTITGTEDRHSTGARVWGRPGRWDYDFEAVYQFGEFDSQEIRAWTVASNTGVLLGSDSSAPRLGVKANVASGDHDASDSALGTFNPLFPRNNYFSEAVLFTPSNFFDVQPSLQIAPTKSTLLTASVDAFFRYSDRDAVYAPGHVAIPADASEHRYVGTTGALQFDWNMTRHATATLAYVHLWAGAVVRDAGGGDVDFVELSLSYRF